MKKILVVCTSNRDKRELATLQNHDYTFIFHEDPLLDLKRHIFASKLFHELNVLDVINSLTQKYSNETLAGVISSIDYPGALVAALLADRLNLPGPSLESVLTCNHKYYSRLAQQLAVPSAVPKFALVDPQDHNQGPPLPFPFFIKPVRSFFSCYAKKISCHEEYLLNANKLPSFAYLEPFNQILSHTENFPISANYLIAEENLEGMQGTIEGYVYNNEIGFLGIVDSIMYPGTISFERFEYPSSLPESIQKRIKEIAIKCIQTHKFNNGLFNIEFIYNPTKKSIHIIEINPRIVSQFADLYEKVDGTNSFEILLDVATGKPPKPKIRKGTFDLAASCVLRTFEDKRLVDYSLEGLSLIKDLYHEARVELVTEKGCCLSSELQDGMSFRYAIIHLGAKSHDDLNRKLKECTRLMAFKFESP